MSNRAVEDHDLDVLPIDVLGVTLKALNYVVSMPARNGHLPYHRYADCMHGRVS